MHFVIVFMRLLNSQRLKPSQSKIYNDFFKRSLKICSSFPLLKISRDPPFSVSIFKKDQLKLEQAKGKMFPLLPDLKEVGHLFIVFLLAL